MSPLDLKHPLPDLLCSSHTPNILHSWTKFDRCASKLLSCIFSSFQGTWAKILRGLDLQVARAGWALLSAATSLHLYFVAILPKGEKTACHGLLESQEKKVVKIPCCGTQPGRGSFPFPAAIKVSLPQKEVLKALEVGARTLEASTARSDRKTGVERKTGTWGCAGRARNWYGVKREWYSALSHVVPALRREGRGATVSYVHLPETWQCEVAEGEGAMEKSSTAVPGKKARDQADSCLTAERNW